MPLSHQEFPSTVGKSKEVIDFEVSKVTLRLSNEPSVFSKAKLVLKERNLPKFC